MVRGGPEVRFNQGSTRVLRGFYTRFCEGCGVVRALKEHCMLLGISPGLISELEHSFLESAISASADMVCRKQISEHQATLTPSSDTWQA